MELESVDPSILLSIIWYVSNYYSKNDDPEVFLDQPQFQTLCSGVLANHPNGSLIWTDKSPFLKCFSHVLIGKKNPLQPQFLIFNLEGAIQLSGMPVHIWHLTCVALIWILVDTLFTLLIRRKVNNKEECWDFICSSVVWTTYFWIE